MRQPDGGPCAWSWADPESLWLQLPEVAVFRLGRSSAEVVAEAPRPVSGDQIMDAYRTIALPLLLQGRGYEALHASAVRTETGVVAFCGASGTGKTTLAFAVSRDGRRPLWADDVVLLAVPAEGSPICNRVPFHFNLRPESQDLFGVGPGSIQSEDADEQARLGAVVVLERCPDSTPLSIRTLGLAGAVRDVLPHAHRFSLSDPVRRSETAEAYLRLCSRTRVLSVRFPPGLQLVERTASELEAVLELTG